MAQQTNLDKLEISNVFFRLVCPESTGLDGGMIILSVAFLAQDFSVGDAYSALGPK